MHESDSLPKKEELAIAVISNCYQEDLLRRWLVDSRANIRLVDAIELQILKLNDPIAAERKIEADKKNKRGR
jgi:hypothetical protein